MSCSHCNSANHLSFDCPRQGETYVPAAADLEQAAAQEPPPPAPVAVKEPGPVFEPGPARFVGCPPICTATNLPAHETEADAAAFHQRNGPSCKAGNTGKCKACGKWHYRSTAPAPGEDDRRGVLCMMVLGKKGLPPGFVPFMRRVRESSFAGHGGTAELPQREAEAVAELPKRLEPKPKRAIKSRAGDLL